MHMTTDTVSDEYRNFIEQVCPRRSDYDKLEADMVSHIEFELSQDGNKIYRSRDWAQPIGSSIQPSYVDPVLIPSYRPSIATRTIDNVLANERP